MLSLELLNVLSENCKLETLLQDAEDKESEALNNRNEAGKFLEEVIPIREVVDRRNLDQDTKIEQKRRHIFRVKKDVNEIERKIMELKVIKEKVR